MSYSIFYKSFGIEFPNNQHLIFVEGGDNNVWEWGGRKRSRGWEVFYSSNNEVFSNSNSVLKWVDGLVNSALNNSGSNESFENIRKSLGWYCGIQIQSKPKSSYLNILGFLNGAMKNRSVKVEDYFDKGYGLTFKVDSWHLKDKNRFDSSKYQTTKVSTMEDFYTIKKEYDNLISDGIVYRYSIHANYYYFELLLKNITYDNRIKRLESIKKSKNYNKGFYIEFNGNYFSKSTKRYTNSSLWFSGAKKFKDLSSAKKKLENLKLRHNSDITILIKRYEVVNDDIQTFDVV